MEIAGIILAIVGILTVTLLFLRDRARQGIRPLEITERDRAQLQEMRRELSIRNVLGTAFLLVGYVSLVGGIAEALFRVITGTRLVDWHGTAFLIVLGLLLILCADRLRKSKW